MEGRTDVVVVGGGLAGLIAACTAAEEGLAVTLVDGRAPGGRARTSQRDGFTFNQGAHALYLGGQLAATCRHFGIVPTGGAPATESAYAVRDGEVLRLPSSAPGMLRSRVFGVRSKIALAKVISAFTKTDLTELALRSVSQWLDDLRTPADVRAFMEMYIRVTTYCNAPDLLSADAAALQYRLSLKGVLYMDGGWQTMVDGLVAAAVTRGVELRSGSPVAAISRNANAWRVELTEGTLETDQIVLAAGSPAECGRLLGQPNRWTTAAGPPTRAACLDLGVSKAAPRPLLFGIGEPLYLSTHTPPADLAPRGHGVIEVMRYLAPDEHSPADTVRAQLWAHATRAGVERDDVVVDRYLHELAVTGGTPLASTGGLRGRPPVADAELPGLYVAGDWVGPDGMLSDSSAASGVAAARAACARAATLVA